LLIGGNKKGRDRFYEEMLPLAEALYEEHLSHLEQEHNDDESKTLG
jgi:hypothetical protein